MENYKVPLIFVGTFAVTYAIVKSVQSAYQKSSCLPPTLRRLPIFGSMLALPRGSEWREYFLKKSAEIGSVIGVYFGPKYAVVLNSRQAINEAFIKRSADFSDRPVIPLNTSFNVNSKGILDHPYNSEFRRQHQLILSILKEFGFGRDIMETRISEEVSHLIECVRSKNGKPFWPDVFVKSSVLNVIISIVVGHRLDDAAVENTIKLLHDFTQDSSTAFHIDLFPILRYIPSYRRKLTRAVALSESLLEFINKSVASCSSDSFIQYYKDREGHVLDSEQLLFTVRDLLLAGTETSATTLLWSMILLANNPDVQKKMHQEIDSNVSRGVLPSLADKVRLPFVEATICEIMRIQTVVPFALPHYTTCDSSIGQFFIPANTMVLANIYAVHMDPAVWHNPTTFRPERFLNEEGEVTGKEQIIPFSTGRRSCLGELLARQEIFLFLTGIVQNFVIEPPEGQKSVEIREKLGVTVAPSPVNVRLIPRP